MCLFVVCLFEFCPRIRSRCCAKTAKSIMCTKTNGITVSPRYFPAYHESAPLPPSRAPRYSSAAVEELMKACFVDWFHHERILRSSCYSLDLLSCQLKPSLSLGSSLALVHLDPTDTSEWILLSFTLSPVCRPAGRSAGPRPTAC